MTVSNTCLGCKKVFTSTRIDWLNSCCLRCREIKKLIGAGIDKDFFDTAVKEIIRHPSCPGCGGKSTDSDRICNACTVYDSSTRETADPELPDYINALYNQGTKRGHDAVESGGIGMNSGSTLPGTSSAAIGTFNSQDFGAIFNAAASTSRRTIKPPPVFSKGRRPGTVAIAGTSQNGAGSLARSLKPAPCEIPKIWTILVQTRCVGSLGQDRARNGEWQDKTFFQAPSSSILSDVIKQAESEALELWSRATCTKIDGRELKKEFYDMRNRMGAVFAAELLGKTLAEILETPERSSLIKETRTGYVLLIHMSVSLSLYSPPPTLPLPTSRRTSQASSSRPSASVAPTRQSERKRTKSELHPDFANPSTSDLDEMEAIGFSEVGSPASFVSATSTSFLSSNGFDSSQIFNLSQPLDPSQTFFAYPPVQNYTLTIPPSDWTPDEHVQKECKAQLWTYRGRVQDAVEVDFHERTDIGSYRYYLSEYTEDSVSGDSSRCICRDEFGSSFNLKCYIGARVCDDPDARSSNTEYVERKARDLAQLQYFDEKLGLQTLFFAISSAYHIIEYSDPSEPSRIETVNEKGLRSSRSIDDMTWIMTPLAHGNTYSYDPEYPSRLFDPEDSKIGDRVNALSHLCYLEENEVIESLEGGFQGHLFVVFTVSFTSGPTAQENFKARHECSDACKLAGLATFGTNIDKGKGRATEMLGETEVAVDGPQSLVE